MDVRLPLPRHSLISVSAMQLGSFARGISGADRNIDDHPPSKGIPGPGQSLLKRRIKADATKTSVANRIYSIVNRVQSLVRDVRTCSFRNAYALHTPISSD